MNYNGEIYDLLLNILSQSQSAEVPSKETMSLLTANFAKYNSNREIERELKNICASMRIAARRGEYFITFAPLNPTVAAILTDKGYSIIHNEDTDEIRWGIDNEEEVDI